MSVEGLRFKRLVKELSFLKSDMEYHSAEFEERKILFYKDYEKFLEESDYEFSEEKTVSQMTDVFNPEQKRMVIEKKTDMSKQNKEMYRKIAKKTHPDLHSDSDKTAIFKKAAKAMEECDWYTLYELSVALGIDVGKHSPMHIEWLTMEIERTSAIIKGITTTFEWIYSEPNVNKQLVLTNYCKITCNKK